MSIPWSSEYPASPAASQLPVALPGLVARVVNRALLLLGAVVVRQLLRPARFFDVSPSEAISGVDMTGATSRIEILISFYEVLTTAINNDPRTSKHCKPRTGEARSVRPGSLFQNDQGQYSTSASIPLNST